MDNCTVYFLAVPPKPAHLQSPLRVEQDQAGSMTSGKNVSQLLNNTDPGPSPNRGSGVSISCVSPAQSYQGSPSPIKGGGSHFLNVSGSHISPARHVLGISSITSSPVLGSPSPGKSFIQNCSPLREGGYSPAKLSPRNCSPLMGRLRTPSPVHGRMGSYSPAKNSKSWLGLHKISSDKAERPEKRGKSLSVPDLVVYMDESR